MFDICLFDLDETLIHTNDIKEIREAGVGDNTPEYQRKVEAALNERDDRHIYSIKILQKIRATYPKMKLGIFTRSPSSYAHIALHWAYPGFKWDIVVAYEDVDRRKPWGDGIDLAMKEFDMAYIQNLPRTILIGDSDVDVRAAYNCGCVAVLDKGGWPGKYLYPHWGAIEHVPDAIIDAPERIFDVLSNPVDFLPALERAYTPKHKATRPPRFDKLGHFVAKAAGGDNTPYQIYVCGRSFAAYESVQYRRANHVLSASIEANKGADVFPAEWVATVRAFLETHYNSFFTPEVVVATVPHRPERKARLENFLTQLAESIKNDPIGDLKVTFEPKLLAYKEGVRSQHGEHLSRDDRFINVRDHLFVRQPALVCKEKAYLIIDDVVTTGASLIYSSKYLIALGAGGVKLLAIAKNVGDVTR